MTVYVLEVTDDDRSSYVIGVFTAVELAKDAARHHNERREDRASALEWREPVEGQVKALLAFCDYTISPFEVDQADG